MPPKFASEAVRLQKYLAECGVASRRKSEELITAGKVRVNGQLVKELGTKIVPGVDRVQVRNKMVAPPHKGIILFHKPKGVVSTLDDPEDRPCVGDYITKHYKSYFPVGRLDFDSSGLMILTNDGEVAERLMHPRYGFDRLYQVRVEGSVPAGVLDKIYQGVKLNDGMVRGKATFARHLQKGVREDGKTSTWLEIKITEGRNRVIRRLFEKLEFPVMKLKRVEYGPFNLGKLRPGDMRALTERDYDKVRQIILRREARR